MTPTFWQKVYELKNQNGLDTTLNLMVVKEEPLADVVAIWFLLKLLLPIYFPFPLIKLTFKKNERVVTESIVEGKYIEVLELFP